MSVTIEETFKDVRNQLFINREIYQQWLDQRRNNGKKRVSLEQFIENRYIEPLFTAYKS